MPDNYNSLRPEAGPVPYWKHHKRAKEALNFIIRVLKGAAVSVEGSKGVDGDLSIDTNRASRIFFVSGEPGSGKSTLYLTLKAMLNSKEKREYQLGYKGKDKIDLDKDLNGVRWLDALDLEVAGDEGENLLAAVLVRLFRKLEESSPVHSKDCEDAIKELEELATDIGIAWEGNLKARAGALDPDTYSAEVIRTQGARLRINERLKEALNKLAEKKCYGCSPGTIFVLPVDDFYLKPEASLQLLRLLRMISIPRLFFLVMGDINTVEALFIEKSLADWTKVAGTGLFTERSDRLDEALTRARELRARYLRKLLPPGQRAEIEAMDWHEALDFEVGRPESNTTAAEILEEILVKVKLDKPLHESKPENRTLLEFLISPSLPPLTSQEKQKREKRAKLDEDAETESPEELALKKNRAAYTALQILDATPREMMDLGSALREVIRRKQEIDERKEAGGITEDSDTPLLLLCVRNIVNLVREEHSFLNEKGQEVLQGILPTRLYSPEDIIFEMNRLCLKPSPRSWIEHTSGQLWVRNHRSWDLTPVDSKFIDDSKNKGTKPDENEGLQQASQDPFAKLPPRPAAWFVLLHDLAWKWNPDSLTENLVKKLCKELSVFNPKWGESKVASLKQEDESQVVKDSVKDSVTENAEFLKLFKRFVDQSNRTYQANQNEEKQEPNPSDDFLGWAIWHDKSDESYKHNYRHFAMPKFETFRDIDRFLHVWRRGLEGIDKREGLKDAKLNEISSIWALAGWTVLAGAYENFAKGSDNWFKDFVERKGTFSERFGDFEKELRDKGVVFDDTDRKDAEMERWVGELEELPEQFQTEREASKEPVHPSDTTTSSSTEE